MHWANPSERPATTWTLELAANHKHLDPGNISVGWLPEHPVLCVKVEQTSPPGQEGNFGFTWLVDSETGALLMQISEAAGSWVATGTGRKEIVL